jgi:hypothetical protein
LRLQSRAAILLKKVNEDRKTPAREPTFRLIGGKKRFLHLLANYILGAKESIDVMTTSERFIVLRFFLEKYFVERAKVGVKLRFLLDKKGNEKAAKEHQQLMESYHSVSFRYARLVDQVPMIIFDGEKATIVTSLEKNPFEAPSLFTTSPTITHALEISYNVLWNKAENLIPP